MMKRSATLVRRLFLLMLVLAGLANTLLPHGVAAGAALSLVNSNYNLIPFCLSGSTVPPSDLGRTFKESRARVNEAFGNLPLGFEANRGHAYDKVKFISRGNGYSLLLSCTDATLMLKAMPRSHWGFGDKTIDGQSQVGDVQVAAVRMSLVGAKTPGRLLGLGELPGKSNYFIGDDKCKWLANVPNYSKVKYEQVYPGIDLIYYGNQRQLEYDFHVAPGANPAAIRISFEGAKNIRVDNGAILQLKQPVGTCGSIAPSYFRLRMESNE
jgi:hypothetical protein